MPSPHTSPQAKLPRRAPRPRLAFRPCAYSKALVRGHIPSVELDRHDAENVLPVWLILKSLAQFGLGSFPRHKEVKRLVDALRACEGVDLRRWILPGGVR
jgi:hypothetical protein